MLFNSDAFIFGFLPVVLLGFLALARADRRRLGVAALALGSLAFYSWWNPRHLPLLLGSIAFNYVLGARLRDLPRRRWLALGVAVDLGLLGYFKYAGFGLEVMGFGSGFSVVLPLAISFFTFQQIAFLVDSYRGQVRVGGILEYALFVSFFPQLIAGPIVRHGEMMGQFHEGMFDRRRGADLAVGSTLFAVGLAKKVIVADTLAVYVAPVFDLAAAGGHPTLVEAWFAALAYAFQIYFDFSGYSDMAIGLARCFGIHLPINFNSPYKAASSIDFWRRWHMTLSRFLRDYLYIPLGGNRKNVARRHVNLMLTMLLGGLWHGAGVTFVVWGGLHGAFLVVNHGWRALRRRLGGLPESRRWTRGLARLITFTSVVVAWVFFRAASLDAAIAMLNAMAGGNGVALHAAWIDRLGVLGWVLTEAGVQIGGVGTLPSKFGFALLGLLWLLAWHAPNSQEILPVERRSRASATPRLALWTPRLPWAIAGGLLGGFTLLFMSRISEFLYFQF